MDTELKLVYLKALMNHDVLYDYQREERIKKVCDSIEEDLGISEPTSLGELKVNIKVGVEGLDKIRDSVDEVAGEVEKLILKTTVETE